MVRDGTHSRHLVFQLEMLMKTKITNLRHSLVCAGGLLWGLTACSEEDPVVEQIENTPQLSGVSAIVPDFETTEGFVTRTILTPTSTGVSFAWKEGDGIGIFSSNTRARFDLLDISETNAQVAKFDGGGFVLECGATYYSFYPCPDLNVATKASVPVSFSGQLQVENGSMAHISQYDYMSASAVASSENEASFKYSHLGAILRVSIVAPQPGVYTQLSITSDNRKFITKGSVDLTTSEGIKEEASDNSISLDLGDISLTDNLQIDAYLALAPVDMSGESLLVTLKNKQGNLYYAQIQGKKYQSGHAYGASISHTYVDLSLPSGTMWATCNVGAPSASAVGNYYAWGEVDVKDVCATDWSNYKWCSARQTDEYKCYNITKYTNVSVWCDTEVAADGLTELLPEDDVAYQLWGNSWRIPTAQQQTELFTYCYWSETSDYCGTGMMGYIVYEPKKLEHQGKFSGLGLGFDSIYSLSDNHIFLPATGQMYEKIQNESWGCYWSRSLYQEVCYDGLGLNFIMGANPWNLEDKDENKYFKVNSWLWRKVGQAIRPVLNRD